LAQAVCMNIEIFSTGLGGMSDPFQHLKDLLGSDLWIDEVRAIEECRASYFITERQTCVVRSDIDINLPTWYMASCWRPDFMSRCERGKTLRLETIKDIAPGDAIVRFFTESRMHEAAVKMLAVSAGKNSEGNSTRFMVRRNFPEAGQVTQVFVSDSIAYRIVEESTSPDSCRLVSVLEIPWPEFPSWALEALHHANQLERDWAAEHQALPLQASAKAFYATLTLKNCSRGLPAVPCSGSAGAPCVQVGHYTWTARSGANFCLADYLNCLLCLEGLTFKASPSLDGQRLVPYQAVMIREDWEASRPHLEHVMQLQATAYRRLKGGTGAPKLRLAGEAHFTEEFVAYEPICMQPPGLTVKNTFVEFPDQDRGPAMAFSERKSVECP